MAKVKITETVLRDSHQSLIATRMTTEQMIPILEELDKVGYHSLEAWGGATFDSCMRFLNEDPWERLRIIRSHAAEDAVRTCPNLVRGIYVEAGMGDDEETERSACLEDRVEKRVVDFAPHIVGMDLDPGKSPRLDGSEDGSGIGTVRVHASETSLSRGRSVPTIPRSFRKERFFRIPCGDGRLPR